MPELDELADLGAHLVTAVGSGLEEPRELLRRGHLHGTGAVPAGAGRIERAADTSVAITLTSQPAVEGSSSRRIIAIAVRLLAGRAAGAPDPQPATVRLSVPLSSSGMTYLRSARICGGFRKKCVSWMVTSSSSRCRSVGSSSRARYDGTSRAPDSRSRSATEQANDCLRLSSKTRPAVRDSRTRRASNCSVSQLARLHRVPSLARTSHSAGPISSIGSCRSTASRANAACGMP